MIKLKGKSTGEKIGVPRQIKTADEGEALKERREIRLMTEILKEFTDILCGKFDNRAQYEEKIKSGQEKFPYARHVNTLCDEKITGLPQDFEGAFMLEESYYTVGENTNAMPHLFLFEEEAGKVKLYSYEIPEGYDKKSFTFENISDIPYEALKPSEKFTPAIYENKGGVWEGGSVSMFSPVMKFTLYERFSQAELEVSEIIEVNGKRVFGYDEPIIYKREEKC